MAIQDVKTITRATLEIRNRGKKQIEHVQETALMIVERYEYSIENDDTGLFDCRLATRLVEALGKGVQSRKLINWFEAFGGISWNAKKKSFGKAKVRKPCLEGAKLTLWVDMEGTDNPMSPEEKLDKRIVSAKKLLVEQGFIVLTPAELELINNQAA